MLTPGLHLLLWCVTVAGLRTANYFLARDEAAQGASLSAPTYGAGPTGAFAGAIVYVIALVFVAWHLFRRERYWPKEGHGFLRFWVWTYFGQERKTSDLWWRFPPWPRLALVTGLFAGYMLVAAEATLTLLLILWNVEDRSLEARRLLVALRVPALIATGLVAAVVGMVQEFRRYCRRAVVRGGPPPSPISSSLPRQGS